MSVDMKAIEEKLARGEALNAEETREVMSSTDADATPLTAEEEAAFEKSEVIDPAKEKEAADAKAAEAAKAALADRAKKAGIKEDATEAEIVEAEKKAAAPVTDDAMDKLQKELEKPDGQEDLTGYTEREKAYFWTMRRERRARQQAEGERDALRLKEAKARKEQEEKERLAKEAEEDPLKDRDPEAPVTVKDLQAMMKRKPVAEAQKPFIDLTSPFVVNSFKLQEAEARQDPAIVQAGDIDEVLECSAEIITNNENYLRQIAQSIVNGENIAKKVYSLIKGDPAFPKVLPIAKARIAALGGKPKADGKQASPDAIKAQEALEKNKEKPKTSAHATAEPGDKAAVKYDKWTADELLKMDEFEFAKVPKKVRDSFLRDMGV